ncbi:hypothetical protein KY290_017381 [Solanum tuberosum]|uniref:Uncharacterized protein n=1 Tax=Solanum tuberosum TaxID=4113 RepID=A0ABQ7VC04_SOLTU|nr:hypothetical protein KY290_017381 [Solanum tuberosum]
MKIKVQAEPHIIWKLVQAGNCSFWWDNWTGIGALAMLCQGPPRNAQNDTLVHVFGEGEAAMRMWNTMGNPLGIQITNQTLANIFHTWCGA